MSALAGSTSTSVEQLVAMGHALSQRGRFSDEEARFREALARNPRDAMAHNNLGWVRQRQGDTVEALAEYQRALDLDTGIHLARRNLATLLVQVGRPEESLPLWCAEAFSGPEGQAWMNDVVERVLAAGDWKLAGAYAAIVAALHWGSRWYPKGYSGPIFARSMNVPERFLTVPKLEHDVEQFRYLQGQGVLAEDFNPIIGDYERLIERMAPRGPEARIALDNDIRRTIGHVFNRIVHVRNTPRVGRALSDSWNPDAVETHYLENRPGVVVVDDFLSPEALEGVRAFCLESTVWSANRYAHGRLGAFFRDGFNCPLLLQIAEELRAAMPRVIGDYPLRQLWGFKNTHHLPGESTTHADFAAVNVNFWVTPTDANLDEASGGMVVYGVDAPMHWDFEVYNGRGDIIEPFLRRQRASSLTIPYRQNRAIIFNSDLFHGTCEVRFKRAYESRRINITMLYGERAQDRHHRQLARPDPMDGLIITPAWRSAAFARVPR
jgi:hypothetical protein